jgi:protein-glutamine gamma-glutamyltransferase
MVMIANRPFDVTPLAEEYPEGSVQRQLLHSMSQSAEAYRYDAVDQLIFELALRNEIVNAARALDRSRFGFAVFHQSRANPAYWDRTDNGGFRLKPGASPSAAINDIFVDGGRYATECATAMVIVYYKALLEVFGEELFDRLFSDIFLMNWHITEPLLREIGTPQRVSDILLGDRGYFANPDVNPQTPQWQGENVIVLPGGLYYGHGIGIHNAERIIAALNANRREGATRSAHFLDSAARPNFKRLAEVYYRSIPRDEPSRPGGLVA